MSESSVIPTPATPDVCSIKILVAGTEIASEFHVLSASVTNELGRIPSASIQLRDGEASKQTFAASDTDQFVPGKDIEIRLGYRGTVETVFKGIVIKHRIRIRKHGSMLMLECRDKAVRMTGARKSRSFLDTTDSDIHEDLIASYGLERDVATTKPSLREIVQYDTTDWDFLVCRAEANGHVVAVRSGRVKVGPPATDAEPVVTAGFGATVLELDAEIDARWQVKGRTATSWNPADQKLAEAEASEPKVTASGNLTTSDLVDVMRGDARHLRHGGSLSDPELQAWADGRLLKDRLAKIRGRVRFQGFAGVTAGDVIEVTGIGKRFAGRQYVAGIRHTFADGNWETDVEFGLDPEPFSSQFPVTARPAGGLVPAVHGLQMGVVTALASDPDDEDDIKVRLPLVSPSEDGVWARLGTLDAGDHRGTFFRPEIGDEVVVGFVDADPRCPVVLGACHSSAHHAPEPGQDANDLKGYQSRSKMRFTFDDAKKVAILETPAGNRVTLSEDEQKVAITDQNGNSVTLDAQGITITSAKDLKLSASGDVTIEGTNVQVSGRAQLKAQGQTSVELSSSGTTSVAGSLVRIN